jgi:hypothetical protein
MRGSSSSAIRLPCLIGAVATGAPRGFLFGGTVVPGAPAWLVANDLNRERRTVALARTLARYLDTIYNTHWADGIFGSDTLNTADSNADVSSRPDTVAVSAACANAGSR